MGRHHARRTTSVVARAVVTVTIALLCSGLGAGGAHAESEHQTDPARDTVGPDATGAPQTSPQKLGDIVRIATAHTRTAVTARLTFREISESGAGVAVRIRTPETEYTVQYVGFFSPGTFTLLDQTGTAAECPGLEGRVRAGKGLVDVSVPRSCLGRPDWVRTGGGSAALDTTPPDGRRLFTVVSDDARRDGRADPGQDSAPALGPRLDRG